MPNQPNKMTKAKLMREMSRMGPLTDRDRKRIEKIDFSKIDVPEGKGLDRTGYGQNVMRTRKDYEDDFDKELAKFEKVVGVETKRDRDLKDKAARQLRAKSMMRTSKPEVRETKQDMILRKKKDLGIVGQLSESDLESVKRSMSGKERKMFNSK